MSSTENFLIKTIKKIRKESPRRFKELRNVCDEILGNQNHRQDIEESEIQIYFNCFHMACDSKQPRLLEYSLEAFNYLIEHGFFKVKETESTVKNDASSSLIEKLVEIVCTCADEYDEGVQLQVIKVLLISITSLHCEVHGASLLLAIRACFHVHLTSKSNIIKTTAKAALTQIVNVVNQRMELNDSINNNLNRVEENFPNESVDAFVEDAETSKNDIEFLQTFRSIYQKDAYLIFRALCKLSMKGVSEETQSYTDELIIQNKILSLELLLSLLQNCGPSFKSNDKFILAVRSYLCVSLLGNCTSQYAQITGLSLQIFVTLIQNFREYLKSEVEIFLSTIFFRILESENSTFDHKLRVLEVLQTICKDPKSQIEFFINYDCDMEASNIFSRIVNSLAKIAKNPNMISSNRMTVDFLSSVKKNQSEDLTLRAMGIEGLLIILKSLLLSSNISSSIQIQNEFKIDSDTLAPSDDILDISDQQGLNSEKALLESNHPDIVEAFDKKQRIQKEIEIGILKFNLSPLKGLKYLASLGHINLQPKDIAIFLHQNEEKLDKTSIGDFLGREQEYENGLSYKVLNEYVDAMDFSDLSFDGAIRFFLRGFRLPGEAQKIDRIMEKFAEKYYLQHRDQFASADMAFILAFSTIMLQTNLHNPAIKDDKRMTKEQFIRQNKGISSDGELSDDLLSEIYDRIAADPISINQDKKIKKEENSNFVVFHSMSERKKKDAFNNERKEMVRAGEAMIRQNRKRMSAFVKNSLINEEAYVKPMFEVVWAPVIGVLSYLLEVFDDNILIEYCIQAFECSIILACRLDCPTAKSTFINALAKFTTLDTIKEMKLKNVLSIKLLLSLALSEGEYLDENWIQVLQTISHLSRLQLCANGVHSDDMFFGDSDSSKKKWNKTGSEKINNSIGEPFSKLFLGLSKAESTRIVEEANAELISKEIDPVLIDRIFINSSLLSSSSVLNFVSSLCEVSSYEINLTGSMNSFRSKDMLHEGNSPRIFSLQKLVEVADYNMDTRARVDWSNIWSLLAPHFTAVGLHYNQALALFAIDSLKQLSIKFLQKIELSNFNFQRLFLKPFEIILSKTGFNETKDLILRCIDIMIKACADNIRSGWKTIFSIFDISSRETFDISKFAFDIIEFLIKQKFKLIVHDFVELLNCLVTFVSCEHTHLSLLAIEHLKFCSEYLGSEQITPELFDQSPSHDILEYSNVIGNDLSVLKLWWPLLLGLSTSVADIRLQVRIKSLETLRIILHDYGSKFSPQTWTVIFKGILFPIIDSAKIDYNNGVEKNEQSKQSWIGSMASKVFSTFVELYLQNNSSEKEFPLLPDLLMMFENCICQETESLANMALRVLKELIFSLGKIFKLSDNILLLKHFHLELIINRLPKILVNCLIFDNFETGKLLLMHHPWPKSVTSKIKNFFFQGYSGFPEILLANRKISTPFGDGILKQIIDSTNDNEIPRRIQISFIWGDLFLVDQRNILDIGDSKYDLDNISVLNNSNMNNDLQRFFGVLKTQSGICLNLIHLFDEICHNFHHSLELSHYTKLLDSLDYIHWSSYCFNENFPLRLKLQQLGLTFNDHSITKNQSSTPELLNQEILSIQMSLRILFKVYHSFPNRQSVKLDDSEFSFSVMSEVQLQTFFGFWFKRLCPMVISKFQELENSLLPDSSNDFSSEEDINEFKDIDDLSITRRNAYTVPVIIILENLLLLHESNFKEIMIWFLSILTDLIETSSHKIRKLIIKIFKKLKLT